VETTWKTGKALGSKVLNGQGVKKALFEEEMSPSKTTVQLERQKRRSTHFPTEATFAEGVNRALIGFAHTRVSEDVATRIVQLSQPDYSALSMPPGGDIDR
jgi:isochorismate synthase EntC